MIALRSRFLEDKQENILQGILRANSEHHLLLRINYT